MPALSPAMVTALDHHRQGALDAAQRAYEQIIASPDTGVPDVASAQHWLGVLHLQRQDAPRALTCFEHALALAPANFASRLNLGHAHLQIGNNTAAFDAFETASQAPEVDIAAAAFAAMAREHMRRAFSTPVSAPDTNEPRGATAAAGSIPEWTPDESLSSSMPASTPNSDVDSKAHSRAHSEAHSATQAKLHGAVVIGRNTETVTHPLAALLALDHAVALQPDMAGFHDSRGSVLNVLGKYVQAEAAHRRALALQPAHPGFHNNLGLAVKAQGRLDDAIWHFRDALRRDPAHVPALINLGQAVAMTGDFDQASAPLTRAIAIAPDNAAAHQELANVFAAMADYDSALTHYARAVALDPLAALAWQNLGAMRFELGQRDTAGEAFEKALSINPSLALARFNLASILLAQGHWQAGWTAYEARQQVWHARSGELQSAPPGVRWHGTDALTDKRILLYAEQGLGDTIQFFRFCAPVAAQAKQVILAIPASLYPLFAPIAATLAGNVTVLPMTGNAPDAYADRHIDYHCPLLSLPLALGIHHPAERPARASDPDIPRSLGVISPSSPYIFGPGMRRTPPQWVSPPQRRGAKTHLLAKRAVTRIARLTWGARVGRSRSSTLATPRTAVIHSAARAAHPVIHKVGLAWSGKLAGLPVTASSLTSAGAQVEIAVASDAQTDAHTDSARVSHPYDKRAVPLAALQPLFDLPNIEWHVLQTEISDADMATLTDLMASYSIVLHSQEFKHFGDTADAVGELDHVVSVDTSVAHLAGAMGWPVSLMLPLAADWRWTDAADRPDTHDTLSTPQGEVSQQNPGRTHRPSGTCYWYPSIRMFKQTHRNDWTPVVTAVAQSLIARFRLGSTR